MTWECDGCGMRGALEVVEAHIITVNTLPNGDFRQVSNIVCWGAMMVGSPSWRAFRHEGIHPMTQVVALVEGALMDTGLIGEVLSD